MAEKSLSSSSAEGAGPPLRVNGHVISDHMINGRRDHDIDARSKLLNAGDDNDDEEEIVVNVQVPTQRLAPVAAVQSHSGLDSSGTLLSLDAPTHHGRKHSTASMRANTWKLKYQDFLPESKSSPNHWTTIEQFSKLVTVANDWLKVNQDVQVKTCQTLSWMSHDVKMLGNSELMVLSKCMAENSTTYYIRGLRLWLTPLNDRRQQTIVCHDVTPEAGDTIQTLVGKVNKKIEQRQLRGKLITLETINVPILNGKLDSQVTRWKESINDDIPYAYALRAFQFKETSHKPHNKEPAQIIGIKDIVPMETPDGYEGFEDLVDRTNTWLKDQTDIDVVNMQSIMAQSDTGPKHAETGNDCFYSMPGLNSPNPVDFFRILRVVYAKVQGEQAAHVPVIYPFTYETFMPELVRHGDSSTKERMEKMNETFAKVIAFLRNSGADLISPEIVFNPMQLYSEEDMNNPSCVDEIKFLFTIRLYLTGQIGRLDGSLRSIKRASISSTRQRNSFAGDLTQGSIHPGPIFLRNVVNRQFRYRWVILALSAFSCMAIIVAVSVVYSNR